MDEAAALYARLLGITRAACGFSHPQTAVALRSLSRARLAQGRAADAVALAERAVSVVTGLQVRENKRCCASVASMS